MEIILPTIEERFVRMFDLFAVFYLCWISTYEMLKDCAWPEPVFLSRGQHQFFFPVKAASPIIENCSLQCGGEQRNWSMATRMDFIEEVLLYNRKSSCFLVEV